MKNSELIKRLEQFPLDTEIVLFDNRQNLFNSDEDGSGIGLYLDFKVESMNIVKNGKCKIATSLTFENPDYNKDGTVNFGSALCSYIEKECDLGGVEEDFA